MRLLDGYAAKDMHKAGEANLKGRKHLDELMFTWDGDTHDPQHVTSTT
jgi:hypothetical protein